MKRVSIGLLVAFCALSAAAQAPHTHDHSFAGAEHWAKVFDDPARDAWQKPTRVVEVMSISEGMAVADVGAGTGYFEPWLSRAVGAKGKVLAVDIEPSMVRFLTERAEREGLANVRAHLAEPNDPRLPAGALDRVLVVDTWHHVDDRPAYARKLAASLGPKGSVWIATRGTADIGFGGGGAAGWAGGGVSRR